MRDSARAGVRWRVLALRAAAVVSSVAGLGFGIPDVIAIASVAGGRGIAYLGGYPTYGGGPFEDIGIRTTVPLLLAFLAVCVTELIACVLLWMRRRSGTVLALALLPVELVFWIGFALPYGPVIGVLRAVLVLLGWRAASTRRVSGAPA